MEDDEASQYAYSSVYNGHLLPRHNRDGKKKFCRSFSQNNPDSSTGEYAVRADFIHIVRSAASSFLRGNGRGVYELYKDRHGTADQPDDYRSMRYGLYRDDYSGHDRCDPQRLYKTEKNPGTCSDHILLFYSRFRHPEPVVQKCLFF